MVDLVLLGWQCAHTICGQYRPVQVIKFELRKYQVTNERCVCVSGILYVYVTFSISSNSIDGQLSDTEKVESCYAFAVSHMRLLVNMYKLSKLF